MLTKTTSSTSKTTTTTVQLLKKHPKNPTVRIGRRCGYPTLGVKTEANPTGALAIDFGRYPPTPPEGLLIVTGPTTNTNINKPVSHPFSSGSVDSSNSSIGCTIDTPVVNNRSPTSPQSSVTSWSSLTPSQGTTSTAGSIICQADDDFKPSTIVLDYSTLCNTLSDLDSELSVDDYLLDFASDKSV